MTNYVEHPDDLAPTSQWAYYAWLARQEAADEQRISEADDQADTNYSGE